MNLITCTLDAIRLDGSTQPRTGIDEATVTKYAEAIMRGDKLPPVVAFWDGTHRWLGDGFHRVHAHRQAGSVEVEVDQRNGTRRDAILHSVGANATHGLPLTNADKHKAARLLLEDAEWGQWSDRRIAEVTHTSPSFVGKVRASLKPEPTSVHGGHIEGSASVHGGHEPEVRKALREGKEVEVKVKPRPAREPEPEAERDAEEGPSAAEIAEARRSADDDAEVVRLLLESDDKLAAMTEKVKQQAALIRTLQARITGLTNEAAQAIRLAKSWRTKYEKLEKTAA